MPAPAPRSRQDWNIHEFVLLPDAARVWSLWSFLETSCWEKMRRGVLLASGGRCALCGDHGALDYAEAWRFFDPLPGAPYPYWGVQSLAAGLAVCRRCRGVFDLSWDLSARDSNAGYQRLAGLCGWSRAELSCRRTQMEDVRADRGENSWALDLEAAPGPFVMQPAFRLRPDQAVFYKSDGPFAQWRLWTAIAQGAVMECEMVKAATRAELGEMEATPIVLEWVSMSRKQRASFEAWLHGGFRSKWGEPSFGCSWRRSGGGSLG